MYKSSMHDARGSSNARENTERQRISTQRTATSISPQLNTAVALTFSARFFLGSESCKASP